MIVVEGISAVHSYCEHFHNMGIECVLASPVCQPGSSPLCPVLPKDSSGGKREREGESTPSLQPPGTYHFSAITGLLYLFSPAHFTNCIDWQWKARRRFSCGSWEVCPDCCCCCSCSCTTVREPIHLSVTYNSFVCFINGHGTCEQQY